MTAPLSVEELVGRSEWTDAHALGRPYVVYKFAATMDGRIAAADGTSQWITSATSRAEVHLLRAGCDATLIGSGTQRLDDPNLAVRGNDDPRLDLSAVEAEGQPFRVVVDTRARTPADAKVLDGAAPTIIAVAPDADAAHLEALEKNHDFGRRGAASPEPSIHPPDPRLRGVATSAPPRQPLEVIRVARAENGLDLTELLSALYRRGVRAVFLEGGPTLAGSFVAAGYVDRIITYIAPALLGAGKAGLVDAGIGTIADILRLELLDVARSGPDVRLIARPSAPARTPAAVSS